jgi:hypothetical protein
MRGSLIPHSLENFCALFAASIFGFALPFA